MFKFFLMFIGGIGFVLLLGCMLALCLEYALEDVWFANIALPFCFVILIGYSVFGQEALS